MERLIGRISYKTANPRDLIAFCGSVEMLPFIRNILTEFCSTLLKEAAADLDPLEDLFDLIRRAIVEEPPITLREGGIIREGFNSQADELRKAKTDGKSWLAELEAKERDKTKTAMGARLLRNWIEQPLIRKEAITARQDAVEELNMSYISM